MMKNSYESVEAWLQGKMTGYDEHAEDLWNPGFDAERQVVITKLGFYNKVFQRPDKFLKRFFHKVYPLAIESWHLTASTQLYNGFCTIEADLKIRFQATFKYVQKVIETMPEVNHHIKAGYDGLLRDLIDKELLKLNDGKWIQTGLTDVEKLIETAVNETLMIKNIQCRALCTLKPCFAEFPENERLDGRFSQESVYLSVLKKDYDFREKQKLEKFRQQQELEELNLQHQQNLFEQQNREDELIRTRSAQEADNRKLTLEDQTRQYAKQSAIEQRLQADKIQHENQMKEMQLEAEIKEQEKQQSRKLQNEQKMLANKIKHEELIKGKQLEAEIEEFEKQQAEWNKAKERLQNEKIKQEQLLKQKELVAKMQAKQIKQEESHKIEEQLELARIKHETYLKEMKLLAEIEEQQKRKELTKDTDEFLRHEIELLILEKQHVELQQEINKVKESV